MHKFILIIIIVFQYGFCNFNLLPLSITEKSTAPTLQFALYLNNSFLEFGARGGTLPAIFFNESRNIIIKKNLHEKGTELIGYEINGTLCFQELNKVKPKPDSLVCTNGTSVPFKNTTNKNRSVKVKEYLQYYLAKIAHRFENALEDDYTFSFIQKSDVPPHVSTEILQTIRSTLSWKIHQVNFTRKAEADLNNNTSWYFQNICTFLRIYPYTDISVSQGDTMHVDYTITKGQKYGSVKITNSQGHYINHRIKKYLPWKNISITPVSNDIHFTFSFIYY